MIVFRYFQQKTPPFQAGSSNETWNGLLVRLPPIFIEAGNGGRFDFGRKNGIDLDRHRLAKPGFHVLPTLKNFLFRIPALTKDGGEFGFDGITKCHHGIPPGISDVVGDVMPNDNGAVSKRQKYLTLLVCGQLAETAGMAHAADLIGEGNVVVHCGNKLTG